ncbi:hypothetical protein HX001_15750 [Empedobacter brevis]|uniref:Uncharacterized protein n=1 Tax=Empedobacter brevis TaxID=247 RepID=A0AAJ1VB53_9FLAO|nr:hypothetical protein [Empedobacter brevis]MDM1073940.1 hypothetical protein [Empedobacter brevis]
MSTNASQTLFRFTSLRNPELTTTKDNLGFITREGYVGGFFDEILKEKTDQNQTKLAYLVSRAKEFKNQSTYLASEDSLKTQFNHLYNSKIPVSMMQINEVIENRNPEQNNIDLTLTLNQIKILWDNLIYQVLTEENFYLKEALFEILRKRNYFTFIYKDTTTQAAKTDFDKIRNAKIVMPEELFVDGVKRKPKLQLSQHILNQIKQKKQKLEVLTQAKVERERLIELKNELSKAQTIYQKNYEKALKEAQNMYQESILEEQEDYELRLLQAEANLSIDATEAQRKLALASVVKPDYKTFNFEFREELDTTFLEEKLSSDSLTALDYVVSKNDINIDLEENQQAERPAGAINFDQDEYESFHDVLKAVEEKIALQDQLIVANTEVEKQQFLNVGGTLLPVSNRAVNLELPEYNLCTKRKNDTGVYDIDFSFQVPDQSFVIKNLSYVIEDEIKAFTHYGESFNMEKVGNKIKLTNLVTDGDNNLEIFPTTEITFSLKINFTNGLMYDFVKIPIVYDGCTKKDSPSEGGFIPSGFGVRRLGIADYLKVEQSTHAYVPGEVAHIENIMAREYREKSTRRLSRTEDTVTSSVETEREQLTDTTTATRFEMQTEIAKMMSEIKDTSASVHTNYSTVSFSIDAGASFANNRSKEESSRTATTQAQDITARALDRIVSKVKEERVRKAVEEFEENNMHGFDNRQGDQHVVGVYRWVDKIMKNQIFNYGKRMMFEFMIPQPSKIHQLAMFKDAPEKELIDEPIDPRKSKDWNLYLPSILDKPSYDSIHYLALKYWAGVYNVELDEQLDYEKEKSVSFSDKNLGSEKDGRWSGSYDKEFDIEEEYEVTSVKGAIFFGEGYYDKGIHPKAIVLLNGKEAFKHTESNIKNIYNGTSYLFNINQQNLHISNKISLSAQLYDVKTISGSLVYTCNLKKEFLSNELRKVYNQVISAYEEALEIFEEKVKQSISTDETDSNIKEANANFYRQMERDVLKHNCMGYLVDPNVLGTKLYDKEKLEDFEILKNKNLDDYTSLAKFMEQAFEWDIMSYNFYPYYWGSKNEWKDLYQSESIDPLFRSFLQSGMARVVVTVKPGFEDAVQFYMSTGKIWNGGEVPVIGDPLYLSLVDEMREPTGEKVGKFWLTRIPTSLNILQAQSIGLEVSEALPFTPENAVDCENPEMLVDAGKFPFKNENALLNGGVSSNEIEEVISGDWTDTTSVD